MNYYYKIQFGYGKDDYLTITQDELHKAFALFVTGKGRGVFNGGAVRGQDILRIVPDWHTAMGWNKTHQMDTFDYEAIEPKKSRYQLIYDKAKQYAYYLIKNNKEDLLSVPFPDVVKKLMLPDFKYPEHSKLLAEKFSTD